MSEPILRFVRYEDIDEIISLYTPYVLETTVTSEYEVPDREEFRRRIESYTARTPWIVCIIDDVLVGYSYASPHRTRAAYQWSVETSIYVRQGYHKRKIASALYTAVQRILTLQGYYNIFVGITYPNQKSLAFHAAMGFEFNGKYHNSMYKFGKWRDVTWMAMQLREWDPEPEPTIPIADLIGTPEYEKILEESAKMILPPQEEKQ